MELSDLIDSVDLLEYVSQYAEFEERNGEYWCLSPLKPEATPSFSIRKELNRFYDFSSGKSGNVINFIREYDRCSYSQAVAKLMEYAGVDGESVTSTGKTSFCEVAKKYSRRHGERKQSKVSALPNDYMEMYETRQDKLAVWEDEGISKESMRKFQVRYDGFSDRIVYPIKSYDGKIINVSGRTIDPAWKEKGLRKYTYFRPLGILDTIYGWSDNISAIRSSREIILFEGAKSVMKADTWGIYNTAAILTSHLNEYQMKALIRLGCHVVFALDKDVNVYEDRNIQRLNRYLPVEVVRDIDNMLTEKMSPVDVDKETWLTLYERRFAMK